MVDFPIREGVRETADSILVVTPKIIDAEWFANDIVIKLSSSTAIAPIVIDFSYDITSIIQYTLNSGSTWNSFNNGSPIDGGQSLFIRVMNNMQVNFRAKIAGNINRVVVGVP